MLLAIDTSTAASTAAVLDGETVLAEVTTLDPRGHSERLAHNVQAALVQAGCAAADIAAVAVGVGPGPYTGLRIGLVTARTFAYLRSVPLHGVCSLDAMAWQAAAELGLGPDLLVASDARRREVYWARYAGRERVDGPAVDLPAALADRHPGLPAVGRGGQLYAGVLGPWAGLDHVRAGWLGRVAQAGLSGPGPGLLLPADPLYLRRPDAAEPTAPKPVLA
ncbi:MAG TPA: tRNA (adenosine(37)-N6)-threonylcarbamoyltransferase complex dimerization subunit type 1 TsaB [Dermatophilaceae bacterium]|nr:tRNA (adenosine(37)-N6)-threonylcarbamoyltransferase complex dimerization subunit type 1 TsaB [Dermatophilaceae bacterium]